MDQEQHNRNLGDDNYTRCKMDFVLEADQQREALPKGVHKFYFIKYRPHEDPKIMRKVAHANFEIQRKGEEIEILKEALKTLEVKHKSIRNILYFSSFRKDYYGMVAGSKSDQLARIRNYLRKDAKNYQMKLHLYEEELLKSIKTLNHHVKNKILGANEERKMLKQIKELEVTKAKIMTTASFEARQNQEKEEKENELLFNKIVDAPVNKWMKSQAKSIEHFKEMHLTQTEKVKQCSKKLKALDTEIRLLKERIDTANSKMEKAREVLLKSEKYCLESLATLNEARALAKEEQTDALEELSKNEMDKFFLQWSNNKSFKDDYERRALQSLESRGLSSDGRIKNSDTSRD